MPSRIPQGQSIRSSKSSLSSDYSDGSHDSSVSTAPTVGSNCPPSKQYNTDGNPYQNSDWDKLQYEYVDFTRPPTSESYRSSISSIGDLEDDLPPFDVPDDRQEVFLQQLWPPCLKILHYTSHLPKGCLSATTTLRWMAT